MHKLFAQVLNQKDLSKAGELFSLEDKDIEADLSDIIDRIHDIADTTDYDSNDNDQSVVEICITRITTAIRETSSIEKHVKSLVRLLEMCHTHNLIPAKKEEDPPHVKIASDVMSCLFMHYSKESVMILAIPAVVQFLDCENKDLSRNVSSYLSLATIDNADLLAKHMALIVASVLQGVSWSGLRKKPSSVMQEGCSIQMEDPSRPHVQWPWWPTGVSSGATQLQVSPSGGVGSVPSDQWGVLKLLEEHVLKFCELFPSNMLGAVLMIMFVDMATDNPNTFVDHRAKLEDVADQQPILVPQVAQIMGALGTVSQTEAKKSMNYLVSRLTTTEPALLPTILQEIRGIGMNHNTLLADNVEEIGKLASSGSRAVRLFVQQIKEDLKKYNGEKEMKSVSSQTEGTITIITVGNPPNATHPSGTVSVKTTTLPSSNMASQQSLAKSSRASSSNMAVGSDRAGSPTSTLVSERLSANSASTLTGQNQSFEPTHDGVQHFCEKHLSKIKNFISSLKARIPLPTKCSVVNGRRRYLRLHFQCCSQSEQCLYFNSYFTLNTRLPKTWIHLMFLSVQAQSSSALSQRDTNVSDLKRCWDALKGERGNSSFLTLMTSTFPAQKDQDTLLHELHDERYSDVFELSVSQENWACFMCNHPEKVSGLLQDGLPVIAGQLKEKKGRWKFLKRWKTRYFTLSGGNFTYSKSDSCKEMLPVSKIQSVKAVRKGIRDIPRAFEIFTADQTYVFKAKGQQNVEQWVQCLHIAVARTQNKDIRPRSVMSDTKL
ncbi:ventricular zone-expressed PH domain-containing protein homolog 1-like [Haliotis rubra]|uniref:ventricular zone-expressed PH domain-containing protein homolog 1-like n=1 Tax=Haliotis rubra TaxID=36100 RepID=UPI001EE5745A|nr:ventricular zone-expressed PH domain-containing protein homolog 1-like [Haliotis rubra]